MTRAALKSALYTGTVMHARRSPRDNVFRYPVYVALLDLDELPHLDRELPLFGWNRSAVTSFHDADHIDIHFDLFQHPGDHFLSVGVVFDHQNDIVTHLILLL